jgi:glycoside/pentoside/hexuronide:cation symporter, GPH family
MTGYEALTAPTPTAALPFRRRFGYGIGDFGFNLFFTTAGLYLLFYYTDVLGLPPATAGWVFAVALIWDAVFDPLMGYLANRTRTRWGRYRPYLLFGAVPLAATWVLMFVPTGLTGTALVIFAVATHMLFRTLYAVVSMPYLALSAVMTSDSGERGVLASFRMMAAVACGLFAAFGTLKFVEAFGGGQTGFLWTAVLYGTLACAIFAFVFANTQEAAEVEGEAAPTVREMLHMLRRNRAFWIVSGAMLAASVGSTMFQKTLPYYLKYALGREDLIGLALTIVTGAAAISIPVWTMVMKRWSKRVMWQSGLAIALCTYPALWLAPQSPTGMLPLFGLLGFAAGAGVIGFWAMMPDTVEYGQWKSGVRAEGAIFGIVSLIQKGGLGIAAGVLGELLGYVGYRANVAQTPETLAAMKLIMIGTPLLCALIALAFVSTYPLDGRTHGRIVKILARRTSS